MDSIKETDSFSKYQIGESVGKGAFGKVFKALNTETGDFCAIKQIEKSIISEKQLPAILQEIKLLKTLQHVNIVKFIESYETPRYLYFALEFIEGGSLAKITKRYGCFQEPLLSRYICQVLKGLSYLHDKGVIHRDIKGDNILITKEGCIKLADFGSCTYSAIDRKLTVVGTPFWMAPEVIQMDMNARSTACDIWSLGCTLLELLTGNPPFWELGTMPAMFAMVNNPHPPIPTTISADLKHFLLACFVRDLNKRPTAAQLLEHPWIKQHYTEQQSPEQKRNRDSINSSGGINNGSGGKVSLNTYADGYPSTSTSSESINSEDSNSDDHDRIQLLEAQKKEMAETIKRLKLHFLRAMKEKKVMKDMISQLVAERDGYMVKLGLTPPPLPAILANTTSHTPTRSALENAAHENSRESSSTNLLSPSHHQGSGSPYGESKHSRSASAPLNTKIILAGGSQSHSPSLSNASASASTSGSTSALKDRPMSSILTNDFFHPPADGDFDDSSSPSNDSFLNDQFEKNFKVSSSPSSLSKNSRLTTKFELESDNQHLTTTTTTTTTASSSSPSLSNPNLGGYYQSNSNLHMYTNSNNSPTINSNNNNNNNNNGNNTNVDMYLRTSGERFNSPIAQPVSLSGAISFGDHLNQPVTLGGHNSLKAKGLVKGGNPILTKENSFKSLNGNINGSGSNNNNSGISSSGSNISNIALGTSPGRKISVSDSNNNTPNRKSSQPIAPSFSLLNQSFDKNSHLNNNNNNVNNNNNNNNTSSSNNSHDSGDEYDEDSDFIEDNENHSGSGNNKSNNNLNNSNVPQVESVVVNVQPPRVNDECKVKCGDGWYDAVVDLVSGSTFVVTIKPFNIKREVSHSDVTLAPLQFPVIVTKKKKFSLFRSNK